MTEFSVSYFAARLEELRRDWPLLVADADIGLRLAHEIDGLDQLMRTLVYAGQPASSEG